MWVSRGIRQAAVATSAAIVLLTPIAAAAAPLPGPAPARARVAASPAPAYFHTLPPGAKLPSGSQCARWVNARPLPENKKMNRTYNLTTGQHVSRTFFSGDLPAANKQIAPRITGDYTGTTQMILRWAACKWGIDQDVVFAQAAVESWWNQTTTSGSESGASNCPPGYRTGTCPQTWGILQTGYLYEKSAWPGIAKSTAMSADTAYGIWRACYDGYEVWLNTVPHVGTYQKGNMWACVGRWYAGRWRTQPAEQYIAKVRQYLREKIWTTPDFQQG